MNAIDLKPVYAENNDKWRIRYASNGNWELQEFHKLVQGGRDWDYYHPGEPMPKSER